MVLVKSTGVVRLVFAFLLTTVFIVIIYNFSTISTHIPKSLEGDNGFRRPSTKPVRCSLPTVPLI